MRLLATTLALALLAASAYAADAPVKKEATAQQGKMATCNKDAADKKGDDRKKFMSECLKAKPAAASTQQDRMKTCNADAKGMKGDDRKKFMSECLKKKA